MNLKILAGALCSTLIVVSCAKDDGGAGEVGPGIVIDGGGGAGNDQLKGGSVPVTPDQLNRIREVACAGPIPVDAGTPPLIDADGGACVYPMLQVPPDSGVVVIPQNIVVLLELTSNQTFFIAQSTSACSGGDGWYLGADGNIVLCPQTCAMATETSENAVQIFAACRSM